MEILNLKRRAGHLLVLCSLMLIILLIAFSPLATGGTLAYADNSDTIGSGGGAIEIDDVTEGLVNRTYSNFERGRKLKVTLPMSTVSVYFAYEIDSSEQVYAISGEADIDEDIPYLLHEGKVEKNEVETKTLGKVTSAWTDISVVYEKKVFYVEVHHNGTLYVECTLDGESDRLKATSLIKDIDGLSPKMQTGIIAHGLQNEMGQAIFECTATFEDARAGNTLAQARSGLAEILIIRTDVALSDMTEGELESADVETICAWEPLVNAQIVLSQKVTFTIDKEGYYYYFVVDRVGNLQINEMLGGKFSREDYSDTDSRFYVTDSSAGSSGVSYSVKNYMITIGEELSEYEDTVNGEVYTKALSAYSTLLLRFYSGESQTNREGISKAWFSFFRNEYTAFKNAYSVGANYSTNIINGDLLPASIKCLNLSSETIKCLGGDEVKASFIIARYEGSEIDQELLNLYGNTKNVKAYKMSYSLTVNGVASTVPKSELIYEIFGLPESVNNFKVYLKTSNGYVECNQVKGENWLRFTSKDLNSGDYYLIYEDTSKTTNLLPLWISLGVVGGLAVVGGVVVLVLWKKGNLVDRTKPLSQEVTEKEE